MHMCLQYKRLNQTSALTACRRQLTSASFLFSSLDILVCGPDETRLAILGADVWQFGFVVRRCSPPSRGHGHMPSFRDVDLGRKYVR